MFQPDGAELFHFDDGFSSWIANLTSVVTDDTWGDHGLCMVLQTTLINTINSPPRHYEVMICSNRLVLGHAHELHMFIKTITPRVRNNKQTAVTNMCKTALLEKLISFSLTFRMLQHSSSDVTID